jgi:hypothetical protein
MLSHKEIAETSESQEVTFGKDDVSRALQIEQVLNRAYEIHRVRGGLFGYDLEDWLEAQRELSDVSRADHFRVEEAVHAASLPRDQERNCEKCL